MQTETEDEIWRSAARSYLACTNEFVRYFGCPRHLTPPPQDAYDERSWVVVPTSRGDFGLVLDWMTIQQVHHNADRAGVLISISFYPLFLLGVAVFGAISASFGASGVLTGFLLLIAGAVGFYHLLRKIIWRPVSNEAKLGRLRLIEIPDSFFDTVEQTEAARSSAKMKVSVVSKVAGAAGGVIAGGFVSGLVSQGAEVLIVKGTELGLERVVEQTNELHSGHDPVSHG